MVQLRTLDASDHANGHGNRAVFDQNEFGHSIAHFGRGPTEGRVVHDLMPMRRRREVEVGGKTVSRMR